MKKHISSLGWPKYITLFQLALFIGCFTWYFFFGCIPCGSSLVGGENPGGLNIPPGGGGGPPPGGGGAGGPPPGGGGGGGGPPPGGGGGGGGGTPPPGGGGGGGGGTDPPGNGGGGGGGIPEPGGGGGGGGPAPLAITEEICAPTPSLTCNEKTNKNMSLYICLSYTNNGLFSQEVAIFNP